MEAKGHVVSRIVTSSSNSTVRYRSKRSRLRSIQLIWHQTLLNQFQNQKDKYAFHFLLLLVVTATQERRVAEWTQRFQLQSKLDRNGAFDFFEFWKKVLELVPNVQSCDVLPLVVGTLPPGHVAMWRSTPRRSWWQEPVPAGTLHKIPSSYSSLCIQSLGDPAKMWVQINGPKIFRSQSGWYRGEWQPWEDPTRKPRLVSDMEE